MESKRIEITTSYSIIACKKIGFKIKADKVLRIKVGDRYIYFDCEEIDAIISHHSDSSESFVLGASQGYEINNPIISLKDARKKLEEERENAIEYHEECLIKLRDAKANNQPKGVNRIN